MDLLGAFAVLDPSGPIGLAERGLIIQAVLFMLIVAVPVLVLTFFFAWYYRASNTKATYTPDWAHSNMEELIWWAIPFEIVLILGALTWTSTHELDPPRPLSEEQPLVIQAVALDWKWLFIYPEQGIASVSYVALPVGQPVRFDITSDAPMNALWIPKLGGMLYAMTGMTNQLNLMASEEGRFDGRSSNYSGEGFAHMTFVAEAMSEAEFNEWLVRAKSSSTYLSWGEYSRVAEPTHGYPETLYAAVEPELYRRITEQFMVHGGSENLPSQAAGHSGNAFESNFSSHNN